MMGMNLSQRNKTKKAIQEYKKKILSSPEASKRFLIELGIFTSKGKLRKPYKNLRFFGD